jgi:hypothetical protein
MKKGDATLFSVGERPSEKDSVPFFLTRFLNAFSQRLRGRLGPCDITRTLRKAGAYSVRLASSALSSNHHIE